jgi:hypothetical protein
VTMLQLKKRYLQIFSDELPASRDLRETSVKRLTRRDLGRPDGDHRHTSAWSDAQSRAGLRAIKLGASRENPMDGGFPAVSSNHNMRLILSQIDF